MSYAERTKGKLTGRWYADAEFKHRDGSVDRWHKAFASKQEADGAEAYFRATGQKPPHLTSGPAAESFQAVADRFKAKHPEWCSGKGGKNNVARLGFACTHLGKLPVSAIRVRELEDYVDKIEKHCGRHGGKVANATVNRYLDVVSKVLSYAHRLDLIPGRPSFKDVRRDNNDGEKRGAISYATEDAICGWLASHGSSVDAFLIHLLCATGMRAGELEAITASQIETPEQVENTGIQLRGDQTKNGHPRWVPLVLEGAKKLRTIIASGRRPKQHKLYENMRKAVKALGENEKISPHWCRHTFNTRANDAGVPLLQVQQIMGHLGNGMSSLYYHPEKARLYTAIEKVQNRLGETRETGEVLSFPSAVSA